MEKYVIYTQGSTTNSDLWVFSRLDTLFQSRGAYELILIGTEETNEPFLAWTQAKSVGCRVHEINSTKHGYSALIKTVKRLFHDEKIDLLVVHNIDAQSMDITHIARTKEIRVVSL